MREAAFLYMQAGNLRALAARLREACLLTEAMLYELRAERLWMEGERLEAEGYS